LKHLLLLGEAVTLHQAHEVGVEYTRDLNRKPLDAQCRVFLDSLLALAALL